MNQIKPAIEITDDGSATLRHPLFGDTYHSTRGAIGESQHVFIDCGIATVVKSHIRVLEVGFGSGLNAWQTLCYGRLNELKIDYITLELYPIDVEIVAALNYTHDPLFIAMHNSKWGELCNINQNFSLLKYNSDITDSVAAWHSCRYDIIYFDAFAPETQPEMWSTEIFRTLYDVLNVGGVLVTYSAKGIVKQALREAGFIVRRLPGALGKRHMLRAEKK